MSETGSSSEAISYRFRHVEEKIEDLKDRMAGLTEIKAAVLIVKDQFSSFKEDTRSFSTKINDLDEKLDTLTLKFTESKAEGNGIKNVLPRNLREWIIAISVIGAIIQGTLSDRMLDFLKEPGSPSHEVHSVEGNRRIPFEEEFRNTPTNTMSDRAE